MKLLQRDFPQTKLPAVSNEIHQLWQRDWKPGNLREIANRYAGACLGDQRTQALAHAAKVKSPADLKPLQEMFARSVKVRRVMQPLEDLNPEAVQRALEDMAANWPDRCSSARLRDLATDLTKKRETLLAELKAGKPEAFARAETLVQEVRTALLANPVLDFDKVLVLKREPSSSARQAMSGELGQPNNWLTNDAVTRWGKFHDELVLLSDLRGSGKLDTIYAPENKETLVDPDLHFDGDRILFAKVGQKEKTWRIWEIKADGSGLHQLTPDDGTDVAHVDPCYLPNGDFIFCSTATYQGLPCVFGSAPMACLYRFSTQTGQIRQLTFEQDSDWCPTVCSTGHVMYQRWEYTDQSHANSRMLFQMNPDGTNQRELRGRGSWFPGSFFFARPIPDAPGQVIGIAGGHHDVGRSGRLLILDTNAGRRDAEGLVQEIPGFGKKVDPIVRDGLTRGAYPQYLMPYPLTKKYHLVVCKPQADSLWGLYLVDVFDNRTLIKEVEDAALLEPIPFRKVPRPPVIPDRVDLKSDKATVHIQDIYAGPGLAGVPRGVVKKIRVIDYYFARRGMGGLYGTLGMDGPWDIKRILGTVPVEPDGSAYFTIPANTPVSLQPLDEKGQALQLMRSWIVGMPGEHVSCTGCHEKQQLAPTSVNNPLAIKRSPSSIDPWFGPPRGFSYVREVQPVLDRYCVSCHNGAPHPDNSSPSPLAGEGRGGGDKQVLISFKGGDMITDWTTRMPGHWGGGGQFTKSYAELHRFVRRPGIEGDRRMLSPLDFHFSQTELGQILRKGHHGVTLDAESHERLAAWVDLNAPFYGTWGEITTPVKGKRVRQIGHVEKVCDRAAELRKKYVPMGPQHDYEAIPELAKYDTTPVIPRPVPQVAATDPDCPGWPFSAQEASRRQKETAPGESSGRWLIPLEKGDPQAKRDGLNLEMVWIPPGEFVMGSKQGHPDEKPLSRVKIDKGFWMARFEVTNAIYKMYDPTHESREEDRHGYQFGITGYDQDQPQQPAVRLNWREAVSFCRWLSAKTGKNINLPTEAQWEWACRAGSATPFWYGDLNTDFSKKANLGDFMLSYFSGNPYVQDWKTAWFRNPENKYDNWIPQDSRFNDGGFITEPVGRYEANPWGMQDMHGNCWEWTRSMYRPYPYVATDGRNEMTVANDDQRVARGGSWYDRPFRATSSYRLPYHSWQKVYNVGFRIVCEDDPRPAVTRK